METKPWHALMLKQVFEYAISFNKKKAEYYIKEEGKESTFASEHMEEVKQYEELKKELNI